jgi:cytochrome b561
LSNLHRSTGALVLLLAIIRLTYRLIHPPAPLPVDVPALQRFAAEASTGAYALLIVTTIAF